MNLVDHLCIAATLGVGGFAALAMLSDLIDDAPAARFTAAVMTMVILALAIGAHA
jgi:hypothetical protein